ncbi:MAG: MBL fold metallo-hydrolase [Evtepia gabavorous]
MPWWERPGSRDEGRRCPAAAGCAWARQGAGAAAGAVSPAHSPAPQPLRELNAYLIRGRERSLLIDTGFREPACRQALQAGLRAAGAEHDPLDVLLTHIHTDHTGLASEVVRPGGAIYIGRGDYPFTSRAWEEEYWGRIDQRFLQEGFPPEELRITTGTNPARTLGPDLDLPNYQPLEDGDRLTVGEYTLEVIAAPGHTPGQICLWMANQQVLFTADHVLFDITPTSPCGPICPTPWAATWRA